MTIAGAQNQLTVVMPLKGRHLFTLRCLFHAQQTRMPFRFLLADGAVHPSMVTLMKDRARYFPDLDIEYLQYPDDRSFSDYFSKMADALRRVNTPYAVMLDNDDFLLPHGVRRAMAFLDESPEFVTCGGRVAGFSLYAAGADDQALCGPFNRLYWYYPFMDRSSNSVAERLRSQKNAEWIYYGVARTETLAAIWREVTEISFSDLTVYDVYHSMRTLTLGRVRMDPTYVSSIRQYGTSVSPIYTQDWVHHFVSSNLSGDVRSVVDRISAAAAESGADPAAVADDVRDLLERRFRTFFAGTFGWKQGVKQLVRRRAPGLAKAIVHRRRLFPQRGLSAMRAALSAAGATPMNIDDFNMDIELVRTVVSGEPFKSFVEPFRSQFVSARAMAAR